MAKTREIIGKRNAIRDFNNAEDRGHLDTIRAHKTLLDLRANGVVISHGLENRAVTELRKSSFRLSVAERS